MTTTKLIPMIHLNGSGYANLERDARAASTACEGAYSALRGMAPHGRDYYPLGDAAFEAAAKEHVLLCAKLAEVIAQIDAHREHLLTARTARTGR